MKKFFKYLIVCSLIVFCLAGCNKKSEQPKTAEVVQETTTTETKEAAPVKAAIVEEAVVTPEVVTPVVVTPEVVTPEVVTPEVVMPEVVTPEIVTPEVVEPKVYDFKVGDIAIKASFLNGEVTFTYPNSFAKADVADAMKYISLILNLDPTQFTYMVSDSQVVVDYPNQLTDSTILNNFKTGLNYYMPYANTAKQDFSLYGLPIYVGADNGKAVIIYPSTIKKDEIVGLLKAMSNSPDSEGFSYSLPMDRILLINYPSQIDTQTLVDGSRMLMAQVLPTYLADLKAPKVNLPANVKRMVSNPVKQNKAYNFNIEGNRIALTLRSPVATVDYPSSISNENINKAVEFISGTLNCKLTTTFNEAGEVNINYPSTMTDNTFINGFETGLNYYLAYYNYSAYRFEFQGNLITVLVKDGDALVHYNGFTSEQVDGMLKVMLKDSKVTNINYELIGSNLLQITYPASINEASLVNGVAAEFNKIYTGYVTEQKAAEKAKAAAAEKVKLAEAAAAEKAKLAQAAAKAEEEKYAKARTTFNSEFKDFEFVVEDVHVTGKVNEKEVIFNYDSKLFDQYLEKALIQIASTMTAYNPNDFTYAITNGQLKFTYDNKINPNEAIDAFFSEVFSL